MRIFVPYIMFIGQHKNLDKEGRSESTPSRPATHSLTPPPSLNKKKKRPKISLEPEAI